MIQKIRLKSVIAAGMLIAGQMLLPCSATAQAYSVPPDLQAKIDSHPHTKKLTDWGSRPEWSADSKKLLFVSKEYGDLFELDVASGQTRPLSFHFSHEGIFRAYYLANGDILLTAPRDHTAGLDRYGRFYESELWLLKSDLSGPAVPFNEPNLEGVAVSRDGMKIVWGRETLKPPAKAPGAEAKTTLLGLNQLWTADINLDGATPALVNKRLLLDCSAPTGSLAKLVARDGSRCFGMEAQNFLPKASDRMTFTMMVITPEQKPRMGIYVVDLKTGEVSPMQEDAGYIEVEGVFPDGKSALVEYSSKKGAPGKLAETLDLWRLALDGSGKLSPVTTYNALDPELKSNQGVISPDGRWLAFTVSTAAIERQAPGQGIGIFLMDLKAAGF